MYKISIQINKISLPVCTLSPICSSDIATDIPLSRVTLAVVGKQELQEGQLLQHFRPPTPSSQTPHSQPHGLQTCTQVDCTVAR